MKNTQPNNQELRRIFLLIIVCVSLAFSMMESRPVVSIIFMGFISLLALKGLVSLKDK